MGKRLRKEAVRRYRGLTPRLPSACLLPHGAQGRCRHFSQAEFPTPHAYAYLGVKNKVP